MHCNVQTEKQYSIEEILGEPVIAGTLRFLLGLALLFAGLYAMAFGRFHGHGLGFFLIFAAPLIMFKDNEKRSRKRL